MVWGARTWPPKPPTLRAPAEPWRFASGAVTDGARTWPPIPPTLRAPAEPWRFASGAVTYVVRTWPPMPPGRSERPGEAVSLLDNRTCS
jgi:hypothetical protein